MEEEKSSDDLTLEAIAILRLLPHNIKHRIDQLRPLRIMPLRPVVPSARLAENEVIRPDMDAEVEETETIEEEKPKRKPIIKLGYVMGILNKRVVEAAEKVRPVPDIQTGDVVQNKLEVPKNKRRLSLYKGIVMSRQNAGIHTTIRIWRIIAGIGVQIVFPLLGLDRFVSILEAGMGITGEDEQHGGEALRPVE